VLELDTGGKLCLQRVRGGVQVEDLGEEAAGRPVPHLRFGHGELALKLDKGGNLRLQRDRGGVQVDGLGGEEAAGRSVPHMRFGHSELVLGLDKGGNLRLQLGEEAIDTVGWFHIYACARGTVSWYQISTRAASCACSGFDSEYR